MCSSHPTTVADSSQGLTLETALEHRVVAQEGRLRVLPLASREVTLRESFKKWNLWVVDHLSKLYVYVYIYIIYIYT